MSYDVAVIGCGRVGLPLALAFADHGLRTLGVENDAERLAAARTLLSDVQSLLRLTLNGDEAAFDETKAPEGQQRLIAATEGARDLGELRARIGAETQAARAIYRRIVEEPALAAGWKPRSAGKGSDS